MEIKQMIMEQFGFRDVKVEKLNENSERSIYKVESEKGEFVLKLFSTERKKEQVEKDCQILQFLKNNNFPAPRLILTQNGNHYGEFVDRYGVLITFIEGQNPLLNEKTAFIMGEMMGRLHNLPILNYPHETGWNIRSETEIIIEKTKERKLIQLPGGEIIPEVISRLQELPDFSSLHKTLIHTDIHPKNMIQIDEKNYVFIDWDDAGIGTSILDLGYVLSQVCIGYSAKTRDELRLETELIASFMKGYYSQRSLKSEEKNNIVYAMQACALIYVIQYWDKSMDLLSWERYKIIKENKEKIASIIT